MIEEKPDDWTGKAYACQCGADAASGDLYLFLDADVRLSPDALSSLVSAYEKTGHVISVQPYHRTERVYEQLSMFFNIIQVAANGLGLLFGRVHVGLYGPVIVISREAYESIGGHADAKNSVTEDLALGEALKRRGIPFELYHGGRGISFRMYGSGLKSLIEGWTKNYATGALKMPFLLLLAVFIWVSACMSPPYHLMVSAFAPVPFFWIYAALYPAWVLTLWRNTQRIGSFTILSLLYPLLLLFFIGVFVVSLFKKLFGLPVKWKDRKIELRG
jgi:4,4'-diaponeurosporenoate glycosyltransferase